MNGPPSSGQHVTIGSRSSRTSSVTTSSTGPLRRRGACRRARSSQRDVARAPQLGRRRRQQRLGEMHEPLDQPQRPLAERQLGAAGGAEQIGDERKVGAGDVGEEQRRTAGGDDAAMDLRGLEIGIDRRGDLDEVVVAAQPIEKRAEIGKHALLRRSRPADRCHCSS